MTDGLRVLYVDDEPDLLAIAKIYLERSGEFSVETFDSAQRVMDSSAIPSYDAIISDYQMPEMDGIEFLKEVRKQYGDIPFLLFTGRGREEVVIDAINNGADFYIQKGGDPKAQFAELAHKLRQAITRKRAQVELRIAYETITTSEEKLRGQYAELARSEQMIRESEARFREFAELLPQIVFETDRRFRVIFVNNQGYIQTGYAPEDVASGFNSLTVIDPSQHARLKDHTERIVRGEHYEHGEYTVIRKDGSTFPALVYGDAVCNGGETTGFRGIIIDISDQKRAEDALRESEEKYRLLVEVNQDIFYSLDYNGTILYVGPQVTDQLGFEPDEMAGHNFTKFIHHDDAGTLVRSMQDYVTKDPHDGSPIISDQFRVRTKDGLYRWYEDKTIDTVDQQGRRVVIGTIRDITDRKRAEEAVFDSRQMLQIVLDTIPQRVFWKDRNLAFLGCNRSLAHDIGYADPAAVIGKTDYDHSSAAIAEHFRADDRAVMESGQPKINFEEPQIRPDGSTAWLRTSKVPLRNREGAIIGVLGTYEDITASKREQEALSESERKYHELADSLPQMIFETDRDLRITYANRHAVSVLGLPGEEESHGINILSLIDPAHHAEVKDSVRKILGGVPFEPKEYTGIKCDGSRFPVNIYSSPVYRNKTLVGFRGIVVDISPQKKREAVLQASEEKFRALVEHSLDGIVITDFSGNFLFTNRAAGSIIDVPDYASLVGTRNVMEFFAPESQADVRKDFYKVAQGIDTYLVHYKVITALQREAWVECIGKKIAYGDSSAMLVSIRDITERKRVEDALRQTNRKLTLLSGINRHDINNQLGVLNGFVELLKRKNTDPSYSDYISRIATASSQISNLIQFTREYERIGVQAPSWQDLPVLVEAAGKSLEPGHVTLINDLPAKMEVFADPLIAKVFFNLIDNAVRHGGPITSIRFSLAEQNGDRIVVCEDDGAGVVFSEKEQIFDLGFGKNTGFGLALSKEILDITGIRISETGEPGTGARFVMTVPDGAYRLAGEKPGPV